MTERQTPAEFENEVGRALVSYAAEAVRPFDPRQISAQALAPAPAARRWWWAGRSVPSVEPRVARIALLVLLLAAAAAVAVVGSRLLTPRPIPGRLAIAVMDQVLTVDPSTGVRHAITPRMPHDGFPVWSPDGTRLAVSQHDGRGQVLLMDADGSNVHPLVEGMTSGSPVAWSPDGARIAFVGYHYPGGDDRGLYVVGADGSGLRLLIPGGGRDMGRLAWSPDGSLIAFAAVDPDRPTGDAEGGRGYVYVVDVESGLISPVSSSPVEFLQDGPLAWRPGRTELLYADGFHEFGERGHQDIVLAERVGGTWGERQLVSGIRRFVPAIPMWLDADRFAYHRDGHLWVAGVDGRPERTIGEPEVGDVGPGCVAPDGSMVAYTIGEASLRIVPTDGGPTISVPWGIDAYGPACSWQALRP